MSSRSRSAPFSTHARGVPLFDKGRFFDVSRHATSALLDLRDIGSSIFWYISMQSWLTFWSLIVNIISVVFFCFFEDSSGNRLAVELDFTFVAFTVVLPLLGFLWFAFQRRERCLALLSECKCLMVSLLQAHHHWVSGNITAADAGAMASTTTTATAVALQQAQIGVATIIPAMRIYFLPSRFYSHNYPYLGYKSAMIQIALDRSRSQRQIKDGILGLHTASLSSRAAGVSPPLEALLHDRTLRLSIVIDQMSNVKEFGTPQGIRSVARFYICLIIPLFFAPYWAWVSDFTNFAFAFFMSIAVQIALVGLMNVAISLEDPFDNSGMDGVFIDEQLYEVEQALLATGADPSLIDSGSGSGGNGGGESGGGGSHPAAPSANGVSARNRAVDGAVGPAPPRSGRVVRVATDAV
ncbi:hypothetical protein Ndes2437A_g02418 [Nannochloris sp. 'desiccata']|nr:hypothetical protein KSW81_001398 [Chlorella desiccata (nom. nud.)]